ncbi:MAG TPA: phosphodiester glycosidase family protein [Solirubrobacteraceae bacterium]|nr:phosphodiester glycosidase family protein [Solirubrobacteraceae bacterium]
MRPGAATSVWTVAVAFCLLSSAGALIQAAGGRGSLSRRDRELRADGLSRTQTVRLAAGLAAAGFICATVVNLALGALTLGYLLAALSQPRWSRRVPYAGVAGLLAGLALRAVAGDIAAGVAVQVPLLLLVCGCALAVCAIRWRVGQAGRPRRVTPGRARARRIFALVLAVLLCVVFISFVVAMNQPSNAPLGVRAVEWLRGNGAAWLVSDFENIYYSWNVPATGGPTLKKLPKIGASHTQAATGYRPPPIRAVIHPALPGEGVWHRTGPLVHGSAPVLVTTFRPDPNYPQLVAGVAWMSSALTRLELYPGRYEPPNAGATPAEVPLRQRGGLLATFNSGFRLEDDQGGFFAQGRLYAPLRKGQATLVAYSNGKVDVRAWRGGPRPAADVRVARQNLPLIVEGGRLNPSLNNGALWGATVGNAVRVWRSGVGVDAHGNLIYAAADIQTAQSLAQILRRAGAVRAMELDINSAWTTFNFYGAWGAGNPQKLLPGMDRPATRYLTPDDRDFFALYAHGGH